uniref:Uncharacterized protein n=1 Tax=Arundo donax TaxID=35708 RepID=A0A0A9E895_ARUDO
MLMNNNNNNNNLAVINTFYTLYKFFPLFCGSSWVSSLAYPNLLGTKKALLFFVVVWTMTK